MPLAPVPGFATPPGFAAPATPLLDVPPCAGETSWCAHGQYHGINENVVGDTKTRGTLSDWPCW